MSQHSGSVDPLSEHPASPALLTSNGPHGHVRSRNCLFTTRSEVLGAPCAAPRWGCHDGLPTLAKEHAWHHAHSQFEDRSRRWASPELCLSCVALPDVTADRSHTAASRLFALAFEPSYPEGNFEGNQLLGGSIGLSPLCHAQATRFARQNSDRLPPQFPMASS